MYLDVCLPWQLSRGWIREDGSGDREDHQQTLTLIRAGKNQLP